MAGARSDSAAAPRPVVVTPALLSKSVFDDLLLCGDSSRPSKLMQNFAAQILLKCAKPGDTTSILKRVGKRPVTFKLLPEKRTIRASAMPRSRRAWLKKQVGKVMSTVMLTPDPQDKLIIILKIIAKKSGLFVAKRSDMKMSIPQCVALRDHMSGTTNALYRLTQSLKVFSPC